MTEVLMETDETNSESSPATSSDRSLSAAFAAVTIVFGPAFVLFTLLSQQPDYGHYLDRTAIWLNSLDAWGYCLVVIALTLLVVAAPVEIFLAKRFSQRRMPFVYLLGFLAIGIVCVPAFVVVVYPTNTLFIVAAMFCVVAGVIGFVARIVYSILGGRRRLHWAINAVAISLAILGFLLPNATAIGTGAVTFFPNRTDGELARVVLTHGEKAISNGMRNYHSNSGSLAFKRYQLVVGCQPTRHTVIFEVEVAEAKTGKLLKSVDFPCHANHNGGSTSETMISEITIPKVGTVVSLRLAPKTKFKRAKLPLAYATVAQSGHSW